MQTSDNWVLALWSEAGVDLHQLKASQPQEFAVVARSPANVPMDVILTLLAAAATQTGDPHIGLRLAALGDLKRMGTYGYLLCNAATLEDLFRLAERYCHILIHTSAVLFQRGAKFSRCEYQVRVPARLSTRHYVEWSLGVFVNAVRARLGDNWYPEAVYFAHEAPANTRVLRRFFGDRLYFSQRANYFEFDSRLLDTRFSDGDPALLEIMKEHADRLMTALAQRDDDLYNRIHLYAIQDLARGDFTLPVLAARMGMSTSTLKRRLAQRGVSFNELRLGLVEQLARQMLGNTQMPVGDIALELGYSGPSAFNRAFRQMTGMAPRDYRREHAGEAEASN